MKLITQIYEDEVIAEFLRAEINSSRFSKRIIDALKDHNLDIIIKPDLSNAEENRLRKNLLGETRGFGENKDLFESFPSEVTWYSAIFSKEDLTKAMYIDYSYWNKLSNDTRLPISASQNILEGIEFYGAGNKGYIEMSSEIKQGKTYPRMIFVSCNENSRIVVLEGHVRLTAYFLDTQFIPEEMEVIIGYSEDFNNWNLY